MNCESCGNKLDNDDLICPFCEESAITDASILHNSSYQCPKCLKGFNKATKVLKPVSARWWQRQSIIDTCPHCEAILNDDGNIFLKLAFPILLIGFLYGMEDDRVQLAAIISSSVLIVIGALKSAHNKNRYKL